MWYLSEFQSEQNIKNGRIQLSAKKQTWEETKRIPPHTHTDTIPPQPIHRLPTQPPRASKLDRQMPMWPPSPPHASALRACICYTPLTHPPKYEQQNGIFPWESGDHQWKGLAARYLHRPPDALGTPRLRRKQHDVERNEIVTKYQPEGERQTRKRRLTQPRAPKHDFQSNPRANQNKIQWNTSHGQKQKFVINLSQCVRWAATCLPKDEWSGFPWCEKSVS